MRATAFLLLLCATLGADVVVLKSGAKVSGRVVDKATHYEVTTEAGLRTYLKEEVDRIVTGPKEFLGDADASYEQAKKDYEAALALPDAQQQARFKEAVARVTVAREAYAGALDLFPEDDTLGKKLMLVMQLMRLCRERLVSDVARGAAPPPRTGSVGTLRSDDALATLLDPAKRADPARRAGAMHSFRAQRGGDAYDMATAAMIFLGRTDAEWRLEGPSLKALQDYFDKGWLKDPARLTAAAHLEAAAFLAGQKPLTESLHLFALAHLSYAPPGPDAEKTARGLGLVSQNGRLGTAEGHAVRDLTAWIANGDFDLAVLAFVKDHRATDTPAVRFVWSYALLRLVQAKRRGFSRPVSAYETVRPPDAAGQEHLAALMKSIRAVAVCAVCAGDGKLRCTNCHGKKEIKYVCDKCKGKGFSVSSLGAQILCNPCKSSGIVRTLKCEKCADGYFDCKQCDKPKPSPALEEICDGTSCAECEGRGLAFRRVLYPCRSCWGLGQKLTPRADPTKILRP